jgi:uncharacterized membrane protein
MKKFAEFTKTTLIGGVLVVLPIYLSILLLAKTAFGLLGLIAPVTAQIPANVELRQMIAILLVLAVCFFAGLVVRTSSGSRARDALERHLLERIPGYTLLRGLAGRIAATSQDETFTPALVRFDDGLMPAFIVEELDDGRYTIFVPSVPTPAAGSLYIMDKERVQKLDVSFTKAVGVISKWGAGASELVKAAARET